MELRTIEQFQATTAASSAKKDASNLNQDDFMTLMLQQLKSQDPFKPTDNTEFISQMAELTSVSGIGEMNTNLASLTASLQSAQLLDASSLIGKEVLVNSAAVSFNGAKSVAGLINLPVSTQGLDIEFLAPNGEVLSKLAMGPQTAGNVEFNWDGRGLNGELLPPGNYQIRASYLNGSTVEAVATQIRSPVKSISVSIGGGSPMVQLDGMGSVSLSQISQISQGA